MPPTLTLFLTPFLPQGIWWLHFFLVITVTVNESMIEICAWNLNHRFKNLHCGTSLGRVLDDLNGTRMVLESTWRKFLVWLEANLCPWVQILEKRTDLMPTPYSVSCLLLVLFLQIFQNQNMTSSGSLKTIRIKELLFLVVSKTSKNWWFSLVVGQFFGFQFFLRTVIIYHRQLFETFEDQQVNGYIPRLITGGYLSLIWRTTPTLIWTLNWSSKNQRTYLQELVHCLFFHEMCPFFENFQYPETEGVLILKFKRAKYQRYFDPEI